MRFTEFSDYQTIIGLNNELVNIVVDTLVVVYKPNIAQNKMNSYNETTTKIWFTGVYVPCLIDRPDRDATEDMQTVNFEQPCTFNFLRNTLNERGIYPEEGDIVGFDNKYYEIDTINEIQLWAGQVSYDHSVVCQSHLTRTSTLQLQKPQL